jgi:predicted acylesterase/phospholipase RssA
MSLARLKAALLLVALGFALGGCAAPAATGSLSPATLAFAEPRPSTAPQIRRGRHVLALSSGGADGAFGAGVLVGWSESGTRPVFDVVSGVSTGALQAPLAFLGPGYDALLEEVFTTTRTEDVFDGNGVGVLLKAGLSDPEPLRRLLDRIITPAMTAAIAAEHAKGRRLLITTTDLTLGRSVSWDIGALAASGRPEAREAMIAIMVASAAPPGFVEPVPLPDPATGAVRLHGDGGVKRPIAVDAAMLEGKGRRTLWVIANGHVSTVAANRLSDAGAATLARRGVSQLLRSLIHGAVERAAILAREEGAAFRLQRIPNSLPEARNPFAFDPAEMRALFEAGRRQGRDRQGWLTACPRPGS